MYQEYIADTLVEDLDGARQYDILAHLLVQHRYPDKNMEKRP